MSVLGSISSILHQYVPSFSLSSVFAIMKGYLPESLIIAAWFTNLFKQSDGKIPTKLSNKSGSSRFQNAFSNCMFEIPPISYIRSLLPYIFLALFTASSTTKSAISDSRAFFILWFFTFDLLNLNIFGMLSIPLLIIFLPMSEPIALEPKLSPVLSRSEPIPLPL